MTAGWSFPPQQKSWKRRCRPKKAVPDAPQDEDDLLTAAVNRAILEGFSPLFAQLMKENDLQPVTDPDFELLALNRAEGFRAGAQFFCLPPLELGEYTGFTQPVQPRPIRELTIELEINRRHGDEDRAADAEGKRALRAKVTQDIYAQRCQQARAVAEQALIAQLGTRHRPAAQAAGGRQLLCRAAPVQSADAGQRRQF